MTYIIEIEIGLGRRYFPTETLFINKKQSARILIRANGYEIEVQVRQVGDALDVIIHPWPNRDLNVHWECPVRPFDVWSEPRQLFNSTRHKWRCLYRIAPDVETRSRR